MPICNTCLMDSSTVEFEVIGSKCSFCVKEYTENIISERKPKGDGSFDCVVGISGGVDSCYALVCAVEAGWKPLVFHYDNGWNSNISVSNIEKIIKKLHLELNTLVTPWKTFKSIQKSFFDMECDDVCFKGLKMVSIELEESKKVCNMQALMPVTITGLIQTLEWDGLQ